MRMNRSYTPLPNGRLSALLPKSRLKRRVKVQAKNFNVSIHKGFCCTILRGREDDVLSIVSFIDSLAGYTNIAQMEKGEIAKQRTF